MNPEYYPPIFLTGKLPKRNSDEIVHFILCAGRLGFEFPKDVRKMIYEELHIVKLERLDIHYKYTGSVKLDRRFDFITIEARSDGVICFNDIAFCMTKGKTYFVCSMALFYVSTEIDFEEAAVTYWSFIDKKSLLYTSFLEISYCLNGNINDETILYLSGTMRKDSKSLTRMDRQTNPEIQACLDLCIKHDIICFNDPLKDRTPTRYLDKNGHVTERIM